MAFSPPVVSYLVKKGLQKGGRGNPRTPLATPLVGGELFGLMFAVQKSQPFFISHTQLGPDYMASFQPGLKFRSAHRPEILLQFHAQFQPGRKTQIFMRMFNEVRKHSR